MNLLRKLNTADRIVAVSAIVLLIASFLDWFERSFEGEGGVLTWSRSIAGWDLEGAILWVFVPVALGLLSLATVLIRAFSRRVALPRLPIGYGEAMFFAGLASAGLVLLKFLLGEGDEGTAVVRGVQISIDVSRSYGIFVALLAAIGFAVGGYLKWQDEQSGHETGSSSQTPF
jgi:hypothetical protein